MLQKSKDERIFLEWSLVQRLKFHRDFYWFNDEDD